MLNTRNDFIGADKGIKAYHHWADILRAKIGKRKKKKRSSPMIWLKFWSTWDVRHLCSCSKYRKPFALVRRLRQIGLLYQNAVTLLRSWNSASCAPATFSSGLTKRLACLKNSSSDLLRKETCQCVFVSCLFTKYWIVFCTIQEKNLNYSESKLTLKKQLWQ